MVMAKIFWKKANKPISEMSQDERKLFAKEFAQDALKNLTQTTISVEIVEKLRSLIDIDASALFELHKEWSDIYSKERKKLIDVEYLNAIKILQKSRKLNREEFIRWSLEYYFLNWLDGVISAPVIMIYDEILNKRSKLIRQGEWVEDFETIYRNISYGEVEQEVVILETLNLLIKEKAKHYEYQINIRPEVLEKANENALEFYLQCLLQGRITSTSDFRSFLPI
jgi:hypothetical protein